MHRADPALEGFKPALVGVQRRILKHDPAGEMWEFGGRLHAGKGAQRMPDQDSRRADHLVGELDDVLGKVLIPVGAIRAAGLPVAAQVQGVDV